MSHDRRRTVDACVCGVQADPVYTADGVGIVYVCRAKCGFDSGAPAAASPTVAADLWCQAVEQARSAGSHLGAIKRAQVRQVLRDAEAAVDPLVLWADMAAQALPELALKKLAASAAVAQAIALVRISQALTSVDDPSAEVGTGAPGQVPGSAVPGRR